MWEKKYTSYMLLSSVYFTFYSIVRNNLGVTRSVISFKTRDEERWFVIACFCKASLDFLGGLLFKYLLGLTRPSLRDMKGSG